MAADAMADDAVHDGAVLLGRRVRAAGHVLVRPVRAVALDACLLDTLLVDYWYQHQMERLMPQPQAWPATSAA